MKTTDQLFSELDPLFTKMYEAGPIELEENYKKQILLKLGLFELDARRDEQNVLRKISMLQQIELGKVNKTLFDKAGELCRPQTKS